MRTSRSLFVLLVTLLAFPVAASASQATHFLVTTDDPFLGNGTLTAGKQFEFLVSPRDESNAFDTTFTGTLHFTSSDSQATFPGDQQLPNSLSPTDNAYIYNATLKTAGFQTITVTQVGGASPISGTSVPTFIAPAAPAKLTIAAPSGAKYGVPTTFVVTARDQFGNRAPDYAGTVHFTSSDASAALPADAQLTQGTGTFTATLRASGNQTITAADTVQGAPFLATAAISVAGPATQLEVIGPASTLVGFPALVGVRGLDATGAFFEPYEGTVHFSSSDGLAALPDDVKLVGGEAIVFATFGTPGAQTLTATDTANPAITGTSDRVFVGVFAPPDGGAAPPPPAPSIGGLRMTSLCVARARLLTARGRGALAASFTVSVAARVTVTVQRLVHAKALSRCPRKAGSTSGTVKTVGTLSSSVRSGRGTVPLARTAAAAKALTPGAYLVRVRATDAAGHRSALATAKLFVLR